jgi:glycerol-3-phosphate dehydrogenase
VIPWRGKSIIGTTDTVYRDHPDRFRVTRDDVRGVLDQVNGLFAGADLGEEDVDFAYGGLRPLVADGGDSSYTASRRPEVLEHPELSGFFTVLGGKYTTSRALAEKVIDRVCARQAGPWKACETAQRPLSGGRFSSMRQLRADLADRFPTVPARKIHTLADRYGSEAARILGEAGGGSAAPILEVEGGEAYYADELRHVSRTEDVCDAQDFLFRRSGIGTQGLPNDMGLRRNLKLLAEELGWGRAEMERQAAAVRSRYQV